MNQRLIRRGWKAVCALVGGGLLQLGACNNLLTGITHYVDPCTSVFANCPPGFFETNAADVGDYCVDPACTVPGGCGQAGPPLGTQIDICP